MKIRKPTGAIYAVAVLFGASLLLSALAAPPRHAALSSAFKFAGNPSPLALTIDPTQSAVRWTLPSSLHTVHGTFAVTRGMLSLEPDSGKASGEIVVNAQSGQSGNDGRDSKMHKEILETTKYPDVVFHPVQVDGKVAPSGPSDVNVRGALTVHGSDHEITSQVHAELTGATWKGRATFDVPYVEWGIKNPSNFFLKASKVVSIEVEMAGPVQSSR
jgi:polyisoprenoid-binding protein YceI